MSDVIDHDGLSRSLRVQAVIDHTPLDPLLAGAARHGRWNPAKREWMS
jgi:hypothetical protein